MATDDAIRIFLHALTERCRSLTAQLNLIRALDFPSTAPLNLADCLAEATDKVLLRTEELSRFFENKAIPSAEIAIEAATIKDFIDCAAEVLCPMLHNSCSNRLPSELVLPMERIARQIFPNCQLVVEAVPDLNYYFKDLAPVIWRIFSSIDLDSILQENNFPQQLFRLQLCSNPPCGVLTHCLLGHEIGHAVYEKMEVHRKLLPELNIDEEDIRQLIEIRLSTLQNKLNDAGQPEAVQLSLEQSREFMTYMTKIEIGFSAAKWIRELFCDVFGTGLFGPAFVCASAMFMLPFQDMDHAKVGYPSNRMRTQITLQSLERSDPGFGYRKIEKTIAADILEPIVKPWKEYVGITAVTPRNNELKIVFRSVLRMKAKIIKEAHDLIGNNALKPSQYKAEIPHLRNRIRSGLPPNEYQLEKGQQFVPATVTAIFNTGWLCYISDMSYLKSLLRQFTDQQITERFFGLISKGIETRDILTRWKEGITRQQDDNN